MNIKNKEEYASLSSDEENKGQQEIEQEEALFLRLKSWFQEDLKHTNLWRQQAHEDYAFYNGDQWNEEDLAILHEQKRPIMTFNRIAPLVNAVIGFEVNNRREVRYVPKEEGDFIANEILTSAGEWFREQANAEDEESEAFTDVVISGMGWIDTRLDFEKNPNGDPVMSRLDPFKMVWDSTSCKANLADAKRIWYIDEKPIHIARDLFPDCDPAYLHADWAGEVSNQHQQEFHDQTEAFLYNPTERTSHKIHSQKAGMCRIVECRWLEKEAYFRAPDPLTGSLRVYSPEEFSIILNKVPDFPHVKHYRQKVKRAFLGRHLLAKIDSPLVPEGSFGWECITGYHDKSKQQFYGFVRPAKDPQRWTNKFFSQIMHILNSQSKGGIVVERGAFDDDSQAEMSWARADTISWVKAGALSAGKIQPKPIAQFPNGFFALFRESKEAITQVSGISPEFIGTRQVNQAGVLERQRQQSSLNLLSYLFNHLRYYRKRQGKIILYLIQNYLSDGRLIRIIGPEKSQYIPLIHDSLSNIEYDILVDDAPTSTNEKERTFAAMQQILPLIRDYITPEIGIEILRYSPLPTTLIENLSQKIQQSQRDPQEKLNPASHNYVDPVTGQENINPYRYHQDNFYE